ncbi:hypothetical protein HXX76_005407 [Chlamydomonas incerta]|uniref:Uncharacterized protein n=1 Tax=Chlamydomonas incerta TaxID=51695 RepID=A0A835W254_CHLIN|nr:hypothetical protein HXX76_005407 [Chlamydomonas incerta]|eukprot:KAG2437787.1 hypothetical protein HXX76_005407 [Chlamydomonas incerta]
MDTAAVELKLLDLAKLVRTAQECQHQSDVLHGLKEDQLAAGIEVLQVQLQQIQRAVWSHDGVVASGAGGSGSALRGSGLSSSDLLLARRTELQSLESRLQALEAGVARDAKAAEEAVAARDQVERMLLERVIALEGSVAGGRAVRSAWAEQQDIRQLRRELADLTSGVAGALSCLGLQPWLGTASEEAADAEAGGGGAAADADAKAAALGQGQGQGPSAAVAGQRLQMAAEQGYGLARVGGAAAAPVPPATEAVGEGADRTVRRSSALQALPPVLQEAMDRTAHAAAAAAVEASEARVAVQREADAARVRALAGVVQSLGGAQRALAGQVEQLAELCPRLLEALQHARQHPASAGAFTTASAAAGGGGGRDAQLEEAYMLAAEAGSLMVGMKKALAEAMVLGTAGAASYSEQLDAAVAGDATLQPMLEEAKVLRGRLAMAAATVPAPSDATTTAAAAAGAKQPSPGLGAQGDLRDTTNTLHGHHDAHTESAKGVVRMSGGNSCAGATRQSPTRQQPPDAPAAAHVVPSALHGSDGSHPGPNHQSPHGAASASSAVSVVSLADLARPHFAGGAAQLAGPNQLPTPWHQQEQEQQPRTSRLPYVYPYREQDATEGSAGGWEGGMRTLALSAALAAQMQAALQGLSSTASLLHAGTAAAAGALTAAGLDVAA